MARDIFQNPKSDTIIERLISFVTDEGDYILDFFSGSGTTAQSVIQLNLKDMKKRKFLLVQLPENLDESIKTATSKTKKMLQNAMNFLDSINKPHILTEIGKERIRRVAKKFAEENPDAKFDGGFRVLKCDTSNMKDVYYNPSEFVPSLLDSMEDNIKEDRTPEDLLFQVMLDLGVLLSSKIEETTIVGKKVFNVADNFLIACFDKEVNDEVIKEIAQKKPYYFVMRDSSMANDSVATNFEQIFATFSPDTVRKVL